ncbi:MAG TPA: DUF6010 family protein, partial [Pyrinomonadaceae bacterium]|nr:DUF6010 family protein [Pyrinomonadaceae bacterium]
LAPRRELRLYAVGLISAALIYVGFVARDVSLSWLTIELAGLLVFTLVALAGLKISPLILAAGWAAHVAWDVLLHGLFETTFVPRWYPPVCVGFDLLLAGYIAVRFSKKVPQ